MSCLVRHIKKTDGFVGLYRGFVPRLVSTYVNGLVAAAVAGVSVACCSVCLFLMVKLGPDSHSQGLF